jgi:hypothetical protein
VAKKDCTEREVLIAELALSLAKQPELRDIDSIAKVIAELEETVTRDDVVSALNVYSKRPPRKIDEAKRNVARIRAEARSDKALHEKISSIEKHIEEGTLPNRKAAEKGRSAALEELQAVVKGLEKDLAKTPAAEKQKLLAQIQRLQAKVRAPLDFTKTPKELPADKEVARLKYERDKLRIVAKERIEKFRPKTPLQRAINLSNTFKALRFSVDYSFLLRQGKFAALSHPLMAAKAAKDAIGTTFSPKREHYLHERMDERENAPLYHEAGLNITTGKGEELLRREEVAMSAFAEKRFFWVAASNRTFRTFLNTIRADLFDAMVEAMPNGKATLEEAKVIARYVNEATGRGSLGAAENSVVGLNALFTAPKFTVSRFQYLAGHAMWAGPKEARAAKRVVAKEYLRTFVGLTAWYTSLLTLFQDEEPIETDPRSSEFGKIKLGDTRDDPLAGLQQAIVLIARMWSGETKTIRGEVKATRGEKVPYGQSDTLDLTARFARQRVAPGPGEVLNVIAGENVVGEKTTPLSVAMGLLYPLSLESMYEIGNELGMPNEAVAQALNFFGESIQTFEQKPRKPKRRNSENEPREKREEEVE